MELSCPELSLIPVGDESMTEACAGFVPYENPQRAIPGRRSRA
jgi:hypothetical protein